MLAVTKSGREYAKMLHLGENNRNALDVLCASVLALCPILQYYIGPFDNAAITILIMVLPWFAIRFVARLRNGVRVYRDDRVISGLVLFFIYGAFIHEQTVKNIVFRLALAALYLFAVCGCINIKRFISAAATIAAAACMLVIIQTACYYLLHRHLQIAPTGLFTDKADAWILLAQTGRIGVTQQMGNLYRPSAFFMEPSHMFLYTFPHLCIVLLSPYKNRIKRRLAILFSIGLLLSTSGMGIVVTVGVWGIYFALSSGRKNQLRLKNLFLPGNSIIVLLFLVITVGTLVGIPLLRQSILRFLDFTTSGAVAGRTRLATAFLKTLRSKDLIFGVTSVIENIGFNMSGFAATLYKFGIIGLILAYWTYVYGVFRVKKQYFWISVIAFAVSFFSAQTHGTFYMIYFVFFILEGWNEGRRKRKSKLTPTVYHTNSLIARKEVRV
ncbi:MAG: hypothetical protein Q4B07_08830 [Clostridia bacterium]|nr:hypothetical protein [Clostridia bacterium]